METPTPARPAAEGTGAAELLLALTNEEWYVPCTSIAHKGQLLDYAASKGVPCLAGPVHYQAFGGMSYRDDPDTSLAWYATEHPDYPSGLMSVEPDDTTPVKVTPAQFCAMCDAYAARHA